MGKIIAIRNGDYSFDLLLGDERDRKRKFSCFINDNIPDYGLSKRRFSAVMTIYLFIRNKQ
jgi:hypothetical protein